MLLQWYRFQFSPSQEPSSKYEWLEPFNVGIQPLTSSNNTSNTYAKVHSLSNSFAIVRIFFMNAEPKQIASIIEVLFIGYLITGPVFYWSNLVGIHTFLFLRSYLCHGDTQNDEKMGASQPLFLPL